MIRKLRKLVPQSLVDYGKHLPEAILANVKYGFPSKRVQVIGVTGTDGKTTTVNMIYRILKDAGRKVSMVSTINAEVAGKVYDTGFHVTNPHSHDVQHFLRQAVQAGDEYMVLEVTSHGLSQFRVWGVDFKIGVITNITHEHLDYHKTFESYLQAKAKLIKRVRYAVLNCDDPNFERLSRMTSGKVLSFGVKHRGDFVHSKFPLKLKIPGDFNIYNALAAAAVASTLGIEKKQIKETLEQFTSLKGRMEEIPNKAGIRVVVDFAHTPNALENALKTLKTNKGKLISVFGAAAQRDLQKRPMMGKISAELADITVLTDEDPRFEDRQKIIDEIARGAYAKGAVDGKNLFKEPDRKKAIELAISLAKKGDTVGIFGKGHESSMNYQGKERAWSDQQAVLDALKFCEKS